ncbi:Na/Pi cotransporter family protein [Acinetobacter rudis]|uniref:Na/Pi symporter n=1 Tax=Acinetobacter rudis TaxID=632955 RepID=A0AAW8J6G9_9GAMM|nr:Na/Pi symporter [Acinetobacter rudis]MDQ8935330.1 Na/Pi symporter [Acinetobacter rudis]MDQ9017593.1 Na/Pi symporter [Acinetobacter rudis]
MLQILAELCGGVGLFLIGMTLLTDSLKSLAGNTLKALLTKFTANKFKAMLSGIGLTILVNSSTATTVATIGFVSAGVLTFAQAIGIIIGANIGTTSTGWIVAFIGLKFSISMFALPLIAFGAIIKLLYKDRTALFGLVVAGFGLIFYGIDVLQVAMAGFSQQSDFSLLAYTGFWSKIVLVFIGIVMAMVLQSSSAAITATMAALASGAIDFPQAIFMVIGQNVGSVSITVLSVIGASINAKRTVAVNVIFNIVSALVAFFVVAPLFIGLTEKVSFFHDFDLVVLLAIFHTAFSVVGAMIFMPLIKQLEVLIIHLLPDDSPSILACLDEASLQVPSAALQSARTVVHYCLFEILYIFIHLLKEGIVPKQKQLDELDHVIAQVEEYLEKVVLVGHSELKTSFLALLRVMIYVRVLRSDLEHTENGILLRTQPMVYQLALDYVHIVESYIEDGRHLTDPEQITHLKDELNNLKKWTSNHRAEIRSKLMEYSELHQLNAAKGLELLAAQRWMDRLIAHSYRLSNVLYESLDKPDSQN